MYKYYYEYKSDIGSIEEILKDELCLNIPFKINSNIVEGDNERELRRELNKMLNIGKFEIIIFLNDKLIKQNVIDNPTYVKLFEIIILTINGLEEACLIRIRNSNEAYEFHFVK